MTPEDAREFPSPEEAELSIDELSRRRAHVEGLLSIMRSDPPSVVGDDMIGLYSFWLRLADAYTVVVEVAERLGDGWYPDEAYGLPVWSLDVHDSTRDEWVTEYEPMTPAHAAFLRRPTPDETPPAEVVALGSPFHNGASE